MRRCEPDQIDHVEEAAGTPLRIDHRQFAEPPLLQQRDRVPEPRSPGDRRRTRGHHPADRFVECGVVAPFEEPGKVAVGEDPSQPTVSVDDHHRPRAALR